MVAVGVEGFDLDGVVAMVGFGLIGSLLVGVSVVKVLVLVWDILFVVVNYLEVYFYVVLLEDFELEMFLVVLLVLGGYILFVVMEGHGRYRLLGFMLDDVVGEVFDKVSCYLGLGYLGGLVIDELVVLGDWVVYWYLRFLV